MIDQPTSSTARRVAAEALDELKAAVGPRGWTEDPSDLEPHLIDWRGRIRGTASLMLTPDAVEAVQAMVRIAVRHGVPLVPQGGNTGLVGGGIPGEDGCAVLVSMRRMNRIRSVDAENFSLVAEAGVPLEIVHEAAGEARRMFPLSIASKGSATVGGLVSTNAGGVQVMRHGTMRALVLGLEAVLPDGSILEQLSPLRKDNTGYDVKQLLIGAEGTLGIVTAASLKLVPEPAQSVVAFAGLDGPEAALRLLVRLRAATGDQVDSFEIIPRASLELVLRMMDGTRDPLATAQPWYVLTEVVSSAPGEALSTTVEGGLAAAMQAGEVLDAVVASNVTQAAELWHLRESLSEADRRANKLTLKHDVALPISDVAAFLREASEEVEGRWPGTQVRAFGHLGDGNLHFDVGAPGDVDPAEFTTRTGPAISERIYEMVSAFSGSISAEHGIGTAKRDTFRRLGDPVKIAAMRAIKAALDPRGIMNPGKLF